MKDGGPVFPIQEPGEFFFDGMTMRQYYKAMALQGIITTPNDLKINGNKPEDVVRVAAIYADAMLKEDEEAK